MIKIEEKEDGSLEFYANSKNVITLLTEFSALVTSVRDDLDAHYDFETAVTFLKIAFYTGMRHFKKKSTKDEIGDALRKEFEP